jgi:hypothetical protein
MHVAVPPQHGHPGSAPGALSLSCPRITAEAHTPKGSRRKMGDRSPSNYRTDFEAGSCMRIIHDLHDNNSLDF